MRASPRAARLVDWRPRTVVFEAGPVILHGEPCLHQRMDCQGQFAGQDGV
jgi:hypothetical protein